MPGAITATTGVVMLGLRTYCLSWANPDAWPGRWQGGLARGAYHIIAVKPTLALDPGPALARVPSPLVWARRFSRSPQIRSNDSPQGAARICNSVSPGGGPDIRNGSAAAGQRRLPICSDR